MHDGGHVDLIDHLFDCPHAAKGLNMSETIEFPEPDGASQAWDAVNRRHLTNREYAELLLKNAAAERAAVPSADGSDGESEAPAKRRKRATAAGEFTDSPAPIQFKLPGDLCRTLKLLSIQQGKSMSEIVLEALTSDTVIRPVWIASRKAG